VNDDEDTDERTWDAYFGPISLHRDRVRPTHSSVARGLVLNAPSQELLHPIEFSADDPANDNSEVTPECGSTAAAPSRRITTLLHLHPHGGTSSTLASSRTVDDNISAVTSPRTNRLSSSSRQAHASARDPHYDLTRTTSATSSSASSTVQEMFASLLKKRGLEMVEQAGDGNCLFRAVSLQVYGDSDQHSEVRRLCLDFMVSDI